MGQDWREGDQLAMTKDDVIFVLNVASDLSGHGYNGPIPLAAAQAQVKAYIKDHPDINDPSLLQPLDRLLKISSAAQVAATYVPGFYNPADYVDPTPEVDSSTVEQESPKLLDEGSNPSPPEPKPEWKKKKWQKKWEPEPETEK
jgi:hypothetical protein